MKNAQWLRFGADDPRPMLVKVTFPDTLPSFATAIAVTRLFVLSLAFTHLMVARACRPNASRSSCSFLT